MSEAFKLYAEAAASGWAPDPVLTIDQCADLHRVLTSETSPWPGRWRTSDVPYAREIMQVLSPRDPVQRVVWMKGAQVAATEVLLNWAMHTILYSPGPMLVVQPTLTDLRKFSKRRVKSMVDSCPELRARIHPARSRDPGNTMLLKEFPGGALVMTGANSASGLSSDPIRFLACDEVDRYPGEVGQEGDPVGLAEARTSNFGRRKKCGYFSTPTVKGESRIEALFLAGDQRRYFVPCPECGEYDYFTWRDEAHFKVHMVDHRPETATMLCPRCGAFIEEGQKTQMLERGRWVASAKGDGRTVSFHLSSLYSPLGWLSWKTIADEFLKADAAAKRGDFLLLKGWVQRRMGEPWEERDESIELTKILRRAEEDPWPADVQVPDGVGVLVASVDKQADRLECKVKGYGAGEESWLIAWEQFYGDPGRLAGPESPWRELDRFLLKTFRHQSGRLMRIECVTVDLHGGHTDETYRFCKARAGRRVFAVRGGNETAKEIVGKPTRKNAYRTPLFTLGTDTAKDTIYSRLRIHTPGPGYMHFPKWSLDVMQLYLDGLTAEKKAPHQRGGRVRWVWEKIGDRRNEPLDLEVYCLAALYIHLGNPPRDLAHRAKRMARPLAGAPPPAPPPADPDETEVPAAAPRARTRAPSARRRGFVNSWRR